MSDRLFTNQDVARKFQVQASTAKKWFSYLAGAGFPFTTSGKARAIHEKDLFVVQEFKRLQSTGFKAQEAATLAVVYWRKKQTHGEQHPPHSCEDRSLHILLNKFTPDALKNILVELSHDRDAVLEEMIANVDRRLLKSALIDRLSDEEVKVVCKQLV